MSKLTLEQIFATTLADAKGNAAMPIPRVDAICNQLLVMAGVRTLVSGNYYHDAPDPTEKRAAKAAADAVNNYLADAQITATARSYVNKNHCHRARQLIIAYELPKGVQKKLEQIYDREYKAVMKTSKVPEVKKQIELLRLALLTGKREQLLPIVKAFQKAFDEINA